VSRIFSLKLARQTAEAFLRDEGISTLPVDPFAIAESRDIVVQGKPAEHEGVSGMLLRHGNDFGIVFATHIPSPGFQRFSVSHELGHYFLPGHIDQVIKDGVHVSRAGFVTNDPYELEADHFAAGLLMPETPFRKAMDRFDPGLDAIDQMAELCVTSRTATAIRFAELSDAAVAIIVSTGGIIDYMLHVGCHEGAAETGLDSQRYTAADGHRDGNARSGPRTHCHRRSTERRNRCAGLARRHDPRRNIRGIRRPGALRKGPDSPVFEQHRPV
jgi:hypothetical protein